MKRFVIALLGGLGTATGAAFLINRAQGPALLGLFVGLCVGVALYLLEPELQEIK